MPEVIAKFEGDYEFLSNFFVAPFEWRRKTYPTAEHAFQCAKSLSAHDEKTADLIRKSATPGEAKRLGRAVKIDVEVWDRVKDDYMRQIVFAKFRNVQGLAGKLINTGCAMLVEGNNWHDRYWGRHEGQGLNKLGVILMETRGFWINTPPF